MSEKPSAFLSVFSGEGGSSSIGHDVISDTPAGNRISSLPENLFRLVESASSATPATEDLDQERSGGTPSLGRNSNIQLALERLHTFPALREITTWASEQIDG